LNLFRSRRAPMTFRPRMRVWAAPRSRSRISTIDQCLLRYLIGCRGRSKFRPLRRRRMQASEHRQSKGQKGLSACLVGSFGGTRSAPVTAAVAGFSSAPWPEFGSPYTGHSRIKDLERHAALAEFLGEGQRVACQARQARRPVSAGRAAGAMVNRPLTILPQTCRVKSSRDLGGVSDGAPPFFCLRRGRSRADRKG
jgi:hypothetical protein